MNPPAFLGMIILPLAASPVIYLAGRLAGRTRATAVAQGVAVVALLVAWLPFAASVGAVTAQPTWIYGTVSLTLDGLSLLLAAVALGLGTLVALYSGSYLRRETGQEKFFAMLVAMVGVMIGLGCAADLFNLWIWFEAMAVCSYLLVAFHRENPASLEAGVKYLVQSAAGSVLVLVGIALVFAQTGALDLATIRAQATASPMLLAAGALFVVGFGVKAALVPLHTWLPDAHSQAPSGISAMLSGVVIEAGLVAMLRSVGALSGITPVWGPLLLAMGAVNMLAGNLMALRQTQVKRLLAFSSLAQVGYMLLGFGVAALVGSELGAQGGLFHLVTHGMMKGLAFLAAGALLFTLHLQRGDRASHRASHPEGDPGGEYAPLTIADLSGAARRYPLAALALSIGVLGLGGIPPLAGFMSKWQIFVAGFTTGQVVVTLLVVFAALNSVLSLAYYAPLVNAVYRRQTSAVVDGGRRMPRSMGVPLLVLVVAIVAVGIWPGLMDWLTVPAGQAVVAMFGGG
jgi:proton-translocating NADH-quinone oxidoreductase chain N